MRVFFFIIFIVPNLIFAQSYDILFVGNSYTYYNNMPQMVADIASSFGDTISFDQSTPGGASLYGHSQNQTTLDKINQQDWDYVVLQDQSQNPSLSPSYVNANVYPYAQSLVNAIEQNYNCSEPLFYMTWGRKYGDQSNCNNYPPVCTYLGMQQRLRDSYINMGNTNNASVSPVGVAFKNSIAHDSTIDLYNNDNSHPSVYGSYLAACTFYSTIFKQPCLGSSFFPLGIDSLTASFLQQIATNTVLDSIATWNIFNSSYEYVDNGLTFDFSNTSSNFETCLWDFGDGNQSIFESPSHTYQSDGIYNVSLSVFTNNGCLVDSIISQIVVTSTNIKTYDVPQKKNKYFDVFGRKVEKKTKGLIILYNGDEIVKMLNLD